MAYSIEREVVLLDKDNNVIRDTIKTPPFDNLSDVNTYVAKLLHDERLTHYRIWPYSFYKDEKINLIINYTDDTLKTDNDYINFIQNIYSFSPLIIKLFGYSPFIDDSKIVNSLSLIDYSLYELTEDILKNGLINFDIENKIISLNLVDINPYYLTGINTSLIPVLEKIIKYLVELESTTFTPSECLAAIKDTCLNGNDNNINITIDNQTDSLVNHFNYYINQVLNCNIDIHTLDSKNIHNELYDQDIEKYFINKLTPRYEYDDSLRDLSLSTQHIVTEALSNNLDVKYLSRENNAILISNPFSTELIIDGITSMDNNISSKLINNIELRNIVLDSHNINILKSIKYTSVEMIIKTFKNHPITIKSLCGENDIVLTKYNRFKLKKIIHEHNTNVFIEQYINDTKYEFLVIDKKVVGILRIDNPSIVGDGYSTVTQLIENLNCNPMRGYKKTHPYRKVKIDDELIETIKKQGYELHSVLKVNTYVKLNNNFLKEKGAICIEVSDSIEQRYKDIAIEVSESLGASICGVQMSINTDNYWITDIIDNPQLDVFALPYNKVKNYPAKEIFKLLNLI